MDNHTSHYRESLERALESVRSRISKGRIVGCDAAQFLVLERDGRGAEVYCGDGPAGVIDPFIGDELQGEINFPTFELALDAAVRWLHGCRLEDLRPVG
jgi:hypothetical protein